MKVLILITKSNWGGAQRYVYDLALNLPKNECEVEVMAGGNGIMVEKLQQVGINASGDLPVGRNINFLEDIKAFFTLVSILRQKRPEVLHLNSSKIGGLGALAGRLTGVPKIIFTSHGWAFNEDRVFFSKLIIKFLHWFTIILSHSTILVSETLQHQMMNWPFIKDKIIVIHNGIENKPIFSKINAQYELAKINSKLSVKGSIVIGSIGELRMTKGYEYSINGVADLINNFKKKNPNQKIVYLIFGVGEKKDDIQKLISNLNLNNSIILGDYLNDAFQYMKAFDIFLLSSLSEGLPYVLLEAGLAGLPIVATAVGGIPEVVDDMKSGVLIQPKKSKEISNALEFYLTHKKMQKEYGSEIHKKVIEEFSIKNMVEKTLLVYKETPTMSQ